MSDIFTVFRQTLHMSVIVDNIKSVLSQLKKSLNDLVDNGKDCRRMGS